MKIGSTPITDIKVGSTQITKVIRNGITYWEVDWTPQTLVVEDASPTLVVMTGTVANTNAVASDFTIAGFTVNSLSRDGTNKILTLTLSTAVSYWDVLVIVIKGVSYSVTNNIVYANYLNNLFVGHVIGLWPMNEASGTVAEDLSGNNNDSMYTNTVSLNQSGWNGFKACNFAGTGNCNIYSAGLASDFNFAAGFLSVWMKCNSDAEWLTNADKNIFTLGQNDNRYANLSLGINSGTVYLHWDTTGYLQIGTLAGTGWVNIAIKWDYASDKIYLYINGINQGSMSSLPVITAGLVSWAGFFGYTSSGGANATACYGMLLDYAPSDSEILKIVNPRGMIVIEGDSRSSAGGAWTNRILGNVSLNDAFGFGKLGIFDAAIPGSGIEALITRATSTNGKMIGANNTLILWIGVNSNGYMTAQQMFDNIKSYCQQAKASGWDNIILCTEIDAVNAGWTAKYQALNVLIKADNSFYDALADLGARSELQNYANTTYFNADGLHLIRAGSDVVVAVVGAAIESLNI